MIDQDVPRNGTTVTLLHWLQPALQRSASNTTLVVAANSTVQGAEYRPPTPPGGSGPHRYSFILYDQPSNFSIPSEYTSVLSTRVGFNLTAFGAAVGLGQPLAGNYLRVLNGTEAETSSAATMTGTVGVAPTESPTVIASTTGSASSTASNNSPSDATTGGEASATESAPAPTETASEASALTKGSLRDLVLGLALAAVGAGMWMA
jgi:hypothetical protein